MLSGTISIEVSQDNSAIADFPICCIPRARSAKTKKEARPDTRRAPKGDAREKIELAELVRQRKALSELFANQGEPENIALELF